MGSMDNCRQFPQYAEALKQLDLCTAVHSIALLDLCHLFVSMHMQRETVVLAISSNCATPIFRYCTHRMRSYSNRSPRDAQRLDTIEVSIDRGIAEAELTFLRWLIKTALRIGRHEQDNPNARITPRL